ncbi:hypothetical protein BSLG_001208 [Batrachochytrium salamandrivorans]|nr:hypothetical protein BSLG_001208 [Batrachochytrium salamandrivorans]
MSSLSSPVVMASKDMESQDDYEVGESQFTTMEIVRMRLQFMEWPIVHATVVGFAILDFLICELSLLSTLFDTATPSAVSTTQQMVYLLETDSPMFTVLRMTLFWFSIAIRLLFLVELVFRILSRTPSAMRNSSFELFDGLIVLLLVPLKFGLVSRIAFVVNFIVVLRISRVYKVFRAFNLLTLTHFEKEKEELINEWHQRLDVEEKRCRYLIAKLGAANVVISDKLG